MKQTRELLEKILTEGHQHKDRTGVGRISLYGETLRFNMQDGFPLVTTREVKYKSIFKELKWFISGSTNNNNLNEQGVKIWDQWAVKEENIDQFIEKYQQFFMNSKEEVKEALKADYLGSIGNLYGRAWRFLPGEFAPIYPDVTIDDFAPDIKQDILDHYLINREQMEENTLEQIRKVKPDAVLTPELREQIKLNYLKHSYYSNIDQLNNLVKGLKKNPYSARHILSGWIPQWIPFEHLSPEENVLLNKGSLAPCHVLIQCHVIPPSDEAELPKLSLQLYQRSADFPVGSVFNIAQYSLLLHLLAKECGYEPYEFIYNLGDVHVYSNQVEQVKEQLLRTPKPLPKLVLSDDITDIFTWTPDQIQIVDYVHDEAINYPVAK